MWYLFGGEINTACKTFFEKIKHKFDKASRSNYFFIGNTMVKGKKWNHKNSIHKIQTLEKSTGEIINEKREEGQTYKSKWN